jgi:hypothetical protein
MIFKLAKDTKKCKSKFVIITGDFFLNDPQISKEERLAYPQMVESIKKLQIQ